jgi:hypothetical protein
MPHAVSHSPQRNQIKEREKGVLTRLSLELTIPGLRAKGLTFFGLTSVANFATTMFKAAFVEL